MNEGWEFRSSVDPATARLSISIFIVAFIVIGVVITGISIFYIWQCVRSKYTLREQIFGIKPLPIIIIDKL